MVEALLVSGITVSEGWAALIVKVNVPEAPCCIDSGLGRSETTVGGGGITATSGVISVTTVLTVPPPPTISGFTPTSGPVGATVTITGANFGATATVFFQG